MYWYGGLWRLVGYGKRMACQEDHGLRDAHLAGAVLFSAPSEWRMGYGWAGRRHVNTPRPYKTE